MEEHEKVKCNDSNESGKNRGPQKQEELSFTKEEINYGAKYGIAPRPFSFTRDKG